MAEQTSETREQQLLDVIIDLTVAVSSLDKIVSQLARTSHLKPGFEDELAMARKGIDDALKGLRDLA